MGMFQNYFSNAWIVGDAVPVLQTLLLHELNKQNLINTISVGAWKIHNALNSY